MKPSPAARELIVIAEPDVGLRATAAGLTSVAEASINSLDQLLASEGVTLEPLFGLSEDLMDRRSLPPTAGATAPAMSLFYRVAAPASRLESLAEQFRLDPAVHAAFVKPGVELAFMNSGREWPPPPPPAPITPDLSNEQVYLGVRGVNAIAAWAKPGGGGAQVRIIDVEGAWRFTHEDLTENQGGVAGGSESPSLDWRNHGTAVLGILSGDRNQGHNLGIIGICPEANVRGVSVFGQPGSHMTDDADSPAAMRQAADLLREGDILLIELHLPGPMVNFQFNEEQTGYVPVEWWPDNLAAIQYAVKKGVIVVEAAGNGAANLDDDIFEQNPGPPHGPFPASWKNPFRRTNVDSGAILVGAGAPARLINGQDFGPSRSRMAFSNYGHNIDAQGWGEDATTCGFGNRLGGNDEDRWYMRDFGGTSAAAPMVAGALACVQGALLAAGKPPLTPLEARELLHRTGATQTDSAPEAGRPATQQIGNRPDLVQMMLDRGL